MLTCKFSLKKLHLYKIFSHNLPWKAYNKFIIHKNLFICISKISQSRQIYILSANI
jgi:hypothetical protein